MDKREAHRILSEKVDELRALGYEELRTLELDVEERTGPSGVTYQLETLTFLDDRRSGNLRVSVGIDDGGWRAFSPMTDDFIMAPDGTFVGE